MRIFLKILISLIFNALSLDGSTVSDQYSSSLKGTEETKKILADGSAQGASHPQGLGYWFTLPYFRGVMWKVKVMS